MPAEAMLLGKPVVATDWSATAEFLDAGCGAPVAAWLRQLADDAGLRARLGKAARRAAMERLGPGPLGEAVAALRA